MHWLISVGLGVVATLVAAAFGATPQWAAGIGVLVFVLYWVIRFCWRLIDGEDIYDLFDY